MEPHKTNHPRKLNAEKLTRSYDLIKIGLDLWVMRKMKAVIDKLLLFSLL